MSKKKLHPDLREAAIKGDAILNKISVQLFGSLLKQTIKTNKFIEQFKVPMKLKVRYKSIERKGDIVEAYIWFLTENYGIEAATRYVKKESIRIIHKLVR